MDFGSLAFLPGRLISAGQSIRFAISAAATSLARFVSSSSLVTPVRLAASDIQAWWGLTLQEEMSSPFLIVIAKCMKSHSMGTVNCSTNRSFPFSSGMGLVSTSCANTCIALRVRNHACRKSWVHSLPQSESSALPQASSISSSTSNEVPCRSLVSVARSSRFLSNPSSTRQPR